MTGFEFRLSSLRHPREGGDPASFAVDHAAVGFFENRRTNSDGFDSARTAA